MVRQKTEARLMQQSQHTVMRVSLEDSPSPNNEVTNTDLPEPIDKAVPGDVETNDHPVDGGIPAMPVSIRMMYNTNSAKIRRLKPVASMMDVLGHGVFGDPGLRTEVVDPMHVHRVSLRQATEHDEDSGTLRAKDEIRTSPEETVSRLLPWGVLKFIRLG